MAGTKAGAQKAIAKILARDPDFFKKIGSKGGANGTTGGFASEKIGKDGLNGKQRAVLAGAIGGKNRKGYKERKGIK